MTNSPTVTYRTRWARVDDLPRLWRISNEDSNREGLSLASLGSYVLRRHPQRHCVVRVDVTTKGLPVVGYACFRVSPDNTSCYLSEVAVTEKHQRKGVASALVELLPSLVPYAPQGFAWKSIVRETELAPQLFLKANGWRCVKTLAEGEEGAFDDPPEAAYCFLLDPRPAPGPETGPDSGPETGPGKS